MALSNPADIQRHLQFKKDVDDLRENGCIRHYSSEIRMMTGEARGNICHYYNGQKPMSDNFLKKFKKAYEAELKRVREGSKPLPVVLKKGKDTRDLEMQILQMLDELKESLTRIDRKLQELGSKFAKEW